MTYSHSMTPSFIRTPSMILFPSFVQARSLLKYNNWIKKCPLLKSNHKCPQAVCSVRDLVPSSNQPKMSPFPPTLFLPQAFVPIIPNHPTRMIARVPSHPNPSQSTRTIKQKKIFVSKRDSRVIFFKSWATRMSLFSYVGDIFLSRCSRALVPDYHLTYYFV